MAKKLFWIDLEMTGLDYVNDRILEVAVIVTDLNFNPLDQFHRVVWQPKELLDSMNDWCREHHGKSGLTAAVSEGTPIAQVEDELIAFAIKHWGQPHKDNRIVICGNSVSNDKRFIEKDMPRFDRHLHYRMIDVSSYKEIFRERYGVEYKKRNAHRAIDDIMESIGELKHYLAFVNLNQK